MRFAVVVGLLGGCLRAGDYHCAAASDCGTSGVCQPGGHCSFADPACTSGQRFGALTGPLANQCVGDSDGGVVGDAGPDGASDGSGAACPSGYITISGGETGHFYRKLSTPADWQTHVSTCAADGPKTYLAWPLNSGELNALRAQDSGNDVWIGISDTANPGTYATVTLMQATYLPWANGEPDATKHCVVARSTQNRIATADCAATQLVGVCECSP